MTLISRWLLGLVLLLFAGLAGGGGHPPPPGAATRDVDLLVEGRLEARRAMKVSLPLQRPGRIHSYAGTCEALARHQETPEASAHALLFEAARWWSSIGHERAQLLYQELVAAGGGDARERARLELAHGLRRGNELSAALVAYESMLLDSAVSRARRDRATWWFARTCELTGDVTTAERAWRRLSLKGRDTCMQVRAWDRLGCSLFTRGDVVGARNVLLRCTRECAVFTDEVTPLGARVRKAIESMTLRRRVAVSDRKKKGLHKRDPCGS